MEHEQTVVDPHTWLNIPVPSFATPDQAIERARRMERGEIAYVRMEVDYGCVLPLWPADDRARAIIENQLNSSLRGELEEWQHDWESSFVHPSGWRSEGERDRWLSKGEAIFCDLRIALWQSVEIIPAFRRMA
ncbi:hypothetical protein [Microbacterium arborescens]|uniref:hypothetical protein n=1 Tax=Microbacterium arborescens TaxID=33883 RepID=UPI002788AB09|nr:hypothetical protein [Microbacterium arborescens]MDQ1217723.1 hypothetical protein [Microbacterium arborescens]